MSGAYDEIVSLGGSCRITYNLRRTFGIRHAFPFDWWVTPVRSMIAFLEDPSLDKLYDPARLEVSWWGERSVVRNTHYGMTLDHEFPRTPDGTVQDDWLQRLEQPRTRTAHVLKRFLDLPATAGRVLFARDFTKEERREYSHGRAQPMVAATIAALTRLLPGLDFDLLLIDPPQGVDLPKVSSLDIYDDSKTDFRGDFELWTERLLGAGLARTASDGPLQVEVVPERDQRKYV